jgi:hypothetical protein
MSSKKKAKRSTKSDKSSERRKKPKQTRVLGVSATNVHTLPEPASISVVADEEAFEEQQQLLSLAKIRILQLTLMHEAAQVRIANLSYRPVLVDSSTQTESAEAESKAPSPPISFYHPGPVLIPGIYSCCHSSMHTPSVGCTQRKQFAATKSF